MHPLQDIFDIIKKRFPLLWVYIRSTINLFRAPFRQKYAINYYPELNTTYFRVPKAANTTIGAIFLKRQGVDFNEDDAGDTNIKSAQFLVTKKEFIKLKKSNPDMYTVTFVRNPYTRLISCYRHILKTQETAVDGDYFGIFKKDMSFEDFAKWVCKIPDFWADQHFKLQTSMIIVDKKLPDFIGKVRSLESDVKILSKELGLPTSVQNHNQTAPANSYTLSEWYTEELAAMVHRRYKKDFELLNYSKTIQ